MGILMKSFKIKRNSTLLQFETFHEKTPINKEVKTLSEKQNQNQNKLKVKWFIFCVYIFTYVGLAEY